jgi:murein hydrolase activator
MARSAGRARALVALAAGVLATFVSASADAQSNRTQGNRSLTQVERDRRAESARAERLRTEALAARREIATLDARLVESAARRGEAEAAALAANERLAGLEQQIAADSERQRRARRGYEQALIAAAFSARRLEPAAVRRGMVARALAPALLEQERRSGRSLNDALALADAIDQERTILAEAQTAIDQERAALGQLLAQRRNAQTRLNRDADAAERRVAALATEARSLRELAQRVQPARRASGPNVIPASWQAPAQGQLVRGYGARDGAAPAAQGATLRTARAAQVLAPAGGRVAYAGPFRSYGLVLILDLEGGYALVLTGLDTISARVGEPVRAGQPVGEMPASDTPAPELYVEVRRNGQPVDPGRWLGARGVAVAANAGPG